MSDWDFLYEMNERGYSAEEIADAAGSGAAPWEWEYIDRAWVDSQLEDEPDAPFKSRDGFPLSTLEQTEIFHDLIDCAIRNRSLSGVLFPPASARNNLSHAHQGGAGSDQGDSDQQQVAAA